MRTDTASDLIANLVLKPGWSVTCESCENRFEGTIKVHVVYPAVSSDREEAPCYLQEIEGGGRASFHLPVGMFNDDLDLYRALLDVFCAIEQHEWREFLRVKPSMWAPYHPHHIDGMNRWGRPNEDFQFGLT